MSWCYINSINYTNSAANMQNNKVLLNNLFKIKLNLHKSFLYKILRKKSGKFHQLTKKAYTHCQESKKSAGYTDLIYAIFREIRRIDLYFS